MTPAQARQRDPDARWATRPGPSVFGSKDHVVADVKNQFIWASGVTPANVHDRQVALGLLEKVPRPTVVYADRGYDSAAIRSGCQVLGHEPRIASRSLGTAGNRRRERKPTTRSRARGFGLNTSLRPSSTIGAVGCIGVRATAEYHLEERGVQQASPRRLGG